MKSFKELGVIDLLALACNKLGWKTPTKIQVEAIPVALEGNNDIIGVAETGSGKTGAFAIPILQALLENPQPFFACVLSPTPERAIQVAEQFEALGSGIRLKCAVLVEGEDFVQQSIVLGKWPWPYIVVATPDRLVDHLCNTKYFSLRLLKFLVLDEADRLLNDDFELVDEILNVIPPQLRIYLFSATMTKRVIKLQRACLKDPVKIAAASKYTLRQQVQEAKGISQMKNKEIGGKKRRKGDEDDARNHQASKKKHHPGPRSRSQPLTKLGKKLKEKLEEISLAATPIKTFVKVYGRGRESHKTVFANGVTVVASIACDEEEGEGYDPSPGPPTVEWATRTLPGRRRSAASGPSSRPLGEGKQTLALPPPQPPRPTPV